MLDGLLGRGFSSKCNSLIKATRIRIDVLRRRKEATQRFLKGNLAQLLSNGLDINAFGRAEIQTEEFLAGLNLLACYDFLEQSCEYILKKLSMMQKHSKCPEECNEAVGSLMFAAARFSDLPELRDLRDALQERYGSSSEHFVNQEFVERLAMKPPTMDKKIQLLKDIALELSLKWDSRGFQQRMRANPSAPAHNQAKKQEPIHDCGTTHNLCIDNETVVNLNKAEQLLKLKSEPTVDRFKAKNGGEMRDDELGHRSFGGVESNGNSGKPRIGSEQNTAKRDNYNMISRGRQEKGELSSDELRANNGRENYLTRKDDASHRSFGEVESTGNSGKTHRGSEENTGKRYNYDNTPQGRRDKSEFSGDEFQTKNGSQVYIVRKGELGHRTFGGVEPTGNSGKPHMGSEQNTRRGRRDKGEICIDKLRAKNGREDYLMVNDELDHLSFGRGEPMGNSGKLCTGNENNTHRGDYYDVTPVGGLQDGEFSSYRLGAKNGRGNYFVRKDESDILLFEQGDSRGNSCKPHIGLENNTPRRENYGIMPVVRLEEGEFNSDGLRAKHGRDNYLMRKDKLANLSYGQGDSKSNSLKSHFGSDKDTVRREIYNVIPHHGRELTGDKDEPTRLNGKDDTVQRRDGHGSLSRGKRPDGIDEQNTSRKEIYSKNEPTRINGHVDIVYKRERHGSLSCGKRPEVTGAIFEAHNNKNYGLSKSDDYKSIVDNKELPTTRDGKIVSLAGYRDYEEPNATNSLKNIQEEDTNRLNANSSYALPPPYVKSKDKLVPPPYMRTVQGKNAISVDPTTHSRDNVEGRSERVRHEDLSNFEKLGSGHERVRSHGHEKDDPYHDNIPLPKPRSIRRKHSKSSSHRDDLGDSEDSKVVKRSTSSRRRDHHHSKKGLQILFDDEHKQKDVEERKIDKLLLHYSKKPSTHGEEKVRRKVKSHAREVHNNGFNEGEASNFPTRSVSLPHEQITSNEQVKVYARANSFQPDKPGGHVHPKLPDYDDLAAQFAALKGC